MADMVAKGRNFTKGPQRPRGESVSTAKLTANQVREIRRRFAGGTAQSRLAKEYGIPKANIHRIVRRKTWRHI
jgi:DNA invertase Pin-like site-specific DNA recombinase